MKCILISIFLSISFSASFCKQPYNSKNSDESEKMVLMHYMGWYGSGSTGRHWEYGHAHTPKIGYYDSRKEAGLIFDRTSIQTGRLFSGNKAPDSINIGKVKNCIFLGSAGCTGT